MGNVRCRRTQSETRTLELSRSKTHSGTAGYFSGGRGYYLLGDESIESFVRFDDEPLRFPWLTTTYTSVGRIQSVRPVSSGDKDPDGNTSSARAASHHRPSDVAPKSIFIRIVEWVVHPRARGLKSKPSSLLLLLEVSYRWFSINSADYYLLNDLRVVRNKRPLYNTNYSSLS